MGLYWTYRTVPKGKFILCSDLCRSGVLIGGNQAEDGQFA